MGKNSLYSFQIIKHFCNHKHLKVVQNDYTNILKTIRDNTGPNKSSMLKSDLAVASALAHHGKATEIFSIIPTSQELQLKSTRGFDIK